MYIKKDELDILREELENSSVRKSQVKESVFLVYKTSLERERRSQFSKSKKNRKESEDLSVRILSRYLSTCFS